MAGLSILLLLASCNDDEGPVDPGPQPNEQPVASFTADLSTGAAPLSVHFDAGASTDPDGPLASYAWSFGDGSTGSGVTVDHVYQDPGLYTPTLTVTDERGAEAVLSGSVITVNSPAGAGANTVQGSVWHDEDADGARGADEEGVPGMPVFLDLDGDGERDAGEPVAFTDADGRYALEGVEDGPVSVTQALPIGWTNTLPGPPVPTPAAGPPQRIISGSVAPEGAFPFQVALVFEASGSNEDAFTCGGTFVAASWVVTAAHCVDGVQGSLQVLVGTNDLRSGGQRVDIESTFIFPAFNTNAFVSNDIAVLELDGTFMLPRVELMTPPKLALANPGTLATVIGWGRTSTGGQLSPVLKQLELEIISNETCKSTLADDVTDATICAGMKGQPAGVCSGDSGGPLLVPDGDGWVQAGIVSFGIFTCVLPEAFARVSELVDFVLGIVEPEPSGAVALDLGGGETAEVDFGNFR